MPSMCRALTLLVALLVSACITPRPMMLLNTAAPLGRGVTELTVGAGLGYSQQTNPELEGIGSDGQPKYDQLIARGFALPTFEANLEHGVSRHIGLNLHASPAGLQPGAKFTLTRGRTFHFSIMPSLGAGYGSVMQTTFSRGQDGAQMEVDNGQSIITAFTFLVGAKFLIWHRSGFYAGVGYDFLLNRSLASSPPGITTPRINDYTTALQHNVAVNLGFDFAFGEGQVHLRPEVAFAVAPITAITHRVVGETTTDLTRTGGLVWAIMPGVAITLGTLKSKEAEAAEEAEDRAAEERRQREEDDAREQDEQAKPKKNDPGDEYDDQPVKRKRSEAAEEEEEQPAPKKKKKRTDEDE